MSPLTLLLAFALVPSPAAGGHQPCPPTPCPAVGPPPIDAYRNERAAKLFALMEANPREPTLRRRLASLYKELGGFTRASEFYAFTADYLEHKPLELKRLAPLVSSTVCNIFTAKTSSEATEEEARIRVAAHAVARALAQDSFFSGSGLAAAEKALEQHGGYCALLAEWSDAFLWHAMAHPRSAAADSQELAVRLLITLAEENISPEGYEGPASAYFLLAQYFGSCDYVSAYVAALIAKERLEAGSATGSENAESFRQRLDDMIARLAKLAKKQRAGTP